MATDKPVVSPTEALDLVRLIEGGSGAPVTETPAKVEERKPRWRFHQQRGVGQPVPLKDGSEFTFPLIFLNNEKRYSHNSVLVTEDEKLAINLREAAKDSNYAIVEVKEKE